MCALMYKASLYNLSSLYVSICPCRQTKCNNLDLTETVCISKEEEMESQTERVNLSETRQRKKYKEEAGKQTLGLKSVSASAAFHGINVTNMSLDCLFGK